MAFALASVIASAIGLDHTRIAAASRTQRIFILKVSVIFT